MDVFEAIKNRRSIRVFTPEEVSEEEIEKIIDAGRHAPSAGNIQPWEFIVIRDSRTKRKLSEAALDQRFLEAVPVVIVVCANELRSSRGYGSRGTTLYCLQDTAAAIQNMLLAACALNLGTCWVGAFREEDARKILNIPKGVRPIALIPIGHPAKEPKMRVKRSVSDFVHYETYGK